MSLSKRLLRHPIAIGALSWVLMMYIRFVYLTNWKMHHIDDAALPYMQGEQNGLFAFWHGRMMMMLPIRPPRKKMHVLSTAHRDGQLSSRTVRWFGNYTIYGSSTRGGHGAVRDMLRALKAGDNVSITPEGPRGPVQVVQKGTLAIAKLSGKPIIPCSFAATRCKRFNSWDKFILPLPFGRLVFCIGAPIMIQRDMNDAEEEMARQTIEQAMNALLAKADGLISPSPLEGEGRDGGFSQHNQTLVTLRDTPLPNPPPQGGREKGKNHA